MTSDMLGEEQFILEARSHPTILVFPVARHPVALVTSVLGLLFHFAHVCLTAFYITRTMNIEN